MANAIPEYIPANAGNYAELCQKLGYGGPSARDLMFYQRVCETLLDFVLKFDITFGDLSYWTGTEHLDNITQVFLSTYGARYWPNDRTSVHYGKLQYSSHSELIKHILRSLFYNISRKLLWRGKVTFKHCSRDQSRSINETEMWLYDQPVAHGETVMHTGTQNDDWSQDASVKINPTYINGDARDRSTINYVHQGCYSESGSSNTSVIFSVDTPRGVNERWTPANWSQLSLKDIAHQFPVFSFSGFKFSLDFPSRRIEEKIQPKDEAAFVVMRTRFDQHISSYLSTRIDSDRFVVLEICIGPAAKDVYDLAVADFNLPEEMRIYAESM